MNLSLKNHRKMWALLLLYAVPYIPLVHGFAYYFDVVKKAYPPFLPALSLIIFPLVLYCVLGYQCGKQRQFRLCIFGSLLQLLSSGMGVWFVLGKVIGNSGEAEVWFPIWSGGMVVCGLIWYWGGRGTLEESK